MSHVFKIYDPDQISLSLGGIPIDGFADGEFCRIEKESAAFEDVVGSNGEVARSKTNDGRATVTFILLQTSDSNDLLSALHNADKNAPGGAGVGALMIRDKHGRALHTAVEAWVSKEPDAVFDRTTTSREWTIRVANLMSFHGGNYGV